MTQWDQQLEELATIASKFVTTTSALLKACPLNDTEPLRNEVDTADDAPSISVPDAFHHIFDRLTQIDLAEQQVKMSRNALVSRRNRMAKVSKLSRLPGMLPSLSGKIISD